jgi:hypothetical protein
MKTGEENIPFSIVILAARSRLRSIPSSSSWKEVRLGQHAGLSNPNKKLH